MAEYEGDELIPYGELGRVAWFVELSRDAFENRAGHHAYELGEQGRRSFLHGGGVC